MAKRPELPFEEAVFDEVFYNKELDYVVVPTSKKAFTLVFIVILFLAGLTLGKTGFFIMGRGTAYALRAEANVSREIKLPTYRAAITDRFGEMLAEHKSSFTVFLNIPTLAHDAEATNRVIESLSQILSLSKDDLFSIVEKNDLQVSNWVPVARNVTAKEAIATRALHEESLQVLDDYERVYKDSPVFAQIIGYTGTGDKNTVQGVSGVESTYDSLIRGEDGRYVFYQDAQGDLVGKRAIEEPKAAAPFELTIDADFQRYFYNRFKDALHALGRNAGTGIALNPQTGEILALISLPSFDANVFVDRSKTADRVKLLTDPSEPLFNRAVSGVYSPGSTIKPLVALASLKAGVFSPDSQVFSDGVLELPNPYVPEQPGRFLDWKAHGWVDVKKALARSSNIYFGIAGGGLPNNVSLDGLISGAFRRTGLGIQALHDAWAHFGFGAKTGVDIPAEGIGYLPTPEQKENQGGIWRLGDTYNVSIGQGDLLVTPLQLASFLASLANGGKIYKPFIHLGETPQILTDYSEEFATELAIVKDGLRDTVKQPYGTAYLLHDLPFAVSAKTGSAQTNNNTRVNALFTGYAPSEDPKIAILILVENAKEGSLNTIPVARDVLQWYYEHRLIAS